MLETQAFDSASICSNTLEPETSCSASKSFWRPRAAFSLARACTLSSASITSSQRSQSLATFRWISS